MQQLFKKCYNTGSECWDNSLEQNNIMCVRKSKKSIGKTQVGLE